MTYVPPTLRELGSYWTDHKGVNLGVVGNQKHCVGYHLGRDRIFSACACRPDGTCEPGRRSADYSVTTKRDRTGLSGGASAIDLGRLGGSLANLYRFSDWLARRCVRNEPGTEDVREVIYSPTGKYVLGFKDGIDFLIRGYSDLSHLTHTHISFYRDAEKRDKTALFRPFFDLPDTGAEMPGPNLTDVALEPGWITVKDIAGVQAVQSDDLAIRSILVPKTRKPTIGKARVLGDPFGKDTPKGSRHIVRLLAGADPDGSQVELAVVLADQVDFEPADPAQPDCRVAVNTALDHVAPKVRAAVEAIEEARPR